LSLWLKVATALAVGSLFGTRAFPQGQIIFNNQVSATVVAPVYDLEPSQPGQSRYGNTGSGVPAGTQSYGGALLAGTNYTAQLFAGPTNTGNLAELQPGTHFRVGNGAGFVVAPNFALRVGGVVEGERGLVQLRVWNNRSGAITNWQQVLADPTIERGESQPFLSPPLGGMFTPPPNLIGLESFSLWRPSSSPFALSIRSTHGIPELTTYGPSGRSCRIDYLHTLNILRGWTPLTNFVLTSSPYVIRDFSLQNSRTRFYRGALLP